MRGIWRIKLFLARIRAKRDLRRAEREVAAFPRIRKKKPHGLPFPLMVSLTSHPARYPTLAKTLKSLLDQRLAPDRTVLWIAHADVAALPQDVRALEHYGLEIRTCDDMRAYTKLVPALLSFPDHAIVTADDDIYYPSDWLELLVAAVDLSSPAIICTRAHLAEIDDRGHFIPYAEWSWETDERADVGPRKRLFPTGVGGVLYPPKALDQAVTNSSQFKLLCPMADDIWFFWMGEMAGTPHRRISGSFPATSWDNTQEVGLYHENVIGKSNDTQIARLEQAYGIPGDMPGAP